MIATPADTTRMGNAARALSSAAVWHSWTNADHWARPAASVATGSGPAPIVIGSNKATIAASDPCPGPQVPPAAGGGSGLSSPVIAKAAPKRPRQTRMSPVREATEGWFTQDHLSCSPMVGGGLPGGRAGAVLRASPLRRSQGRCPGVRGRNAHYPIGGTPSPCWRGALNSNPLWSKLTLPLLTMFIQASTTSASNRVPEPLWISLRAASRPRAGR